MTSVADIAYIEKEVHVVIALTAIMNARIKIFHFDFNLKIFATPRSKCITNFSSSIAALNSAIARTVD